LSDGQLSDGWTQEAAPALREVDALVAAGARRAVGDIASALDRMRRGRYGDCRSCGDAIPLAVLEAIPQTTLCLACQIRRDHGR
jgi:DnaK suppressor protein